MITSTAAPNADDFARFAERFYAAHAIECALVDASEPEVVLDIALHHYRRILGNKATWPAREHLH